MESFDAPYGATPLDPSELEGLKFKNIAIDPLHIPVEIRKLLDDARYWIENQTYNRIELAARLHHRLVRIHPFPNGNGRIARLFTNAVLVNEMKEKPLVWSAGKLHVIPDNEERRSYIDALRAADAGDMQPLIDYLAVRNPA